MAIIFQNTIRLPILIFVKKIFICTNNYNKRSIMTTRIKFEKVLENLEKNPFFEKYANKIAKLQQTSPEEFLQRVKNQEKLQKKKEKQEEEYKFYQSEAKPHLNQIKQPQQAKLNSIMKMDMIQNMKKDEIIKIWKDYHKDKDYICGILTSEQFDKMFERGKRYSTFLLPLPRKQGYEFIVSQFYGLEIHMTPLIWYQTHKENAPECLTMIHYIEFKDNKGIILMRGEFDKKCISVQEAQCLVNELQLYYCTDNIKRLELLETFTNKPDEFHLSKSCHIQSLFPFLMTRTKSSWSYIKKRNFCDNAVKNIYITTPIFYVNAGPHIGHLYTAVLADTIARFNAMLGHSVFLSTGTDEHGTKVQKAANKAILSTFEYCTQISHQFQEMCDIFQVKYSKFIRTTEEQHQNAVLHFWNCLEKNGHIYRGKYSGWYNISEETFISDKEIIEKNFKNIKIKKGCIIESGDTIEWMEEDSYKFRLTSFKDQLKYWLKNENVIEPAIYRKILIPWLEELQDLSISRPISRVPWAIPTPSDKSHTIYVWLDALVNYLTSVGYPNNSFKEFWPPTVQIIGKDILKFHGIYWPAFLMAAGLEPPKKLICHGHWAVKDKKMSKSKGNVISPFIAMNDFTQDGLRYFLLRQAILDTDANYNKSKVRKILNSELADTLGNLVNRCFGKTINPDGIIYNSIEYKSILNSELAVKNIKILENLSEEARKCYEKSDLYHVVDHVMDMLRSANQVFAYYEPWNLSKSKDLNSEKQVEAVISLILENLRVAALVLYPIIPQLSSNLLDFLQVSIKNRNWEDTKALHLTNDSNETRHVLCENILFFKKIKN